MKYHDTIDVSGNRSVSLNVKLTGFVILVPGGRFKIDGQDYILPPETIELQKSEYTQGVIGYIVKMKSDGQVMLLVEESDEHKQPPFQFMDSHPFIPLYTLFSLIIHAGQEPSDSNLVVWRTKGN